MKIALMLGSVATAGMLAALWSCGGAGSPPYKNSKLPVEQRIEDLLGRMTLE